MITKLLRNALGSLLAGGLLALDTSRVSRVVSDLAFPVLVIYPDAGVELFEDAAALGDMSTQRVVRERIHSPHTPLLIDAELRIFRLLLDGT